MKEGAEAIIKKHAVLSLSAGFIPIPVFDVVTVTALQLDMLKQLASLYGVDFKNESGKAFISALTGGAIVRLGGSLIKSIPGVGSVLGGISVAAISGATTYAVGEIACKVFEKKADLADVSIDKFKDLYEEAVRRGKEFIAEFSGGDSSEDVSLSDRLAQLEKAYKDNLLTEDEYKEYRAKILDQI